MVNLWDRKYQFWQRNALSVDLWTDAVFMGLSDDKGALQNFYEDSAYTGECPEKIVESKKMVNKACEKCYRNKPLTDLQKENNSLKSIGRSRVEHIFGFMEIIMNGMYLYNIGIKRISGIVGLMNLTYNMFRKIQLKAI